VFVPRTAPGDVVRVEIVEEKPRWARGRVREVVQEGEGRRDAPCPSYDECGGCRLQHLTVEEQRRAKRQFVQEALRRIGGLDVAVPDLVAAGGEFGYRNRVTFSARWDAGQWRAGFRRIDDPAAVVDVGLCMLAEAPISAAWTSLREVWKEGAWDQATDDDTRITVRASIDGEVDLLISGAGPLEKEGLDGLVGRVPGLVGCHYAPPGGEPTCLAGQETLADRWQETEFDLPADVFLQVNRRVSAEIDSWLDERAGSVAGQRVLDLYSGVGARAIRWAASGAQVSACEISERAAAACLRAADRAGVNVDVVAAAVESRIDSLMPADLVVVNPPRAGLSRRASDALISGSARRLAYVSCDPATLARDLGRLAQAWDLVDVQPFDAFPQTAHVETAVWLVRR
jgi:23S rRNA (uracil1939-C5)-methyltransferase